MSENKVIVIDGSYATQLSRYVDLKIDEHPLWCSGVNAKQNPEAVIQSHLDYLNAGAEYISTNTYQASIDGFKKYMNLNEEESIEILKNTVKLAHKAREIFMDERNIPASEMPKIVGLLGPYGAHLHNGSEYTGSYASYVTEEEIIEWHRPNIQSVLDAGVDIIGFITIPCKMEAEILLQLMYNEFPDNKFWLSFQCKDEESLANGEKFSNVVKLIWNKAKALKNHNLLTIGINCMNPKYVTPLFQNLDDDDIPLLVKPTSGEIFDPTKG